MQRGLHRRLTAAGGLGIALLCLSGCAMPLAGQVTAPTIPATQIPAAPTTAAPALRPSGPAPALKNSGTNWAPMLASLLGYGQWLLANPGAAPVGNVAGAGCPLTDKLTTEVANLSGEGWRLTPAPLTLSSISVPTRLAPGETTVSLQLQASRAAETIVDAGGRPTSSVAALPPAIFDVTVLLGGDRKWRLCSAQPTEPVLTTDGADDSDPSLL
jgi:hypothetical protein